MATDKRRLALIQDLDAWIEKPLIVLSAIWLMLLVAELLGHTNRTLQVLGVAIWVVFILEFALRLALAPNKLKFLGQNVITMVALVVPAFRLFRVVRVLRFARIARGVTLVRVVAGANRSMNALRRTMGRRGLGYVLTLTVIICVLGALGMRAFEADGPNGAAFGSFGDALWWTAMILTTMGSQDWPATGEGRMLALLLSIYAFAVFGYVAATLASYFVGRDQEAGQPKARELADLRREIRLLRDDIAKTRSAERDAG